MKSTKEIYQEIVQVPFWETRNNHILGYFYESYYFAKKDESKLITPKEEYV